MGLSRERGSPVLLHVTAYTEDGPLNEAGFWTPDEFGQWGRCADLWEIAVTPGSQEVTGGSIA
jgi:hypothetical protein